MDVKVRRIVDVASLEIGKSSTLDVVEPTADP